MDSVNGATPEPGSDAGIDELQADIDQTRRQLGETVSALAHKTDVKARAQEKMASTREAAADKAHTAQVAIQRNPRTDVAVVAVVAAAIGLLIWLRRRR